VKKPEQPQYLHNPNTPKPQPQSNIVTARSPQAIAKARRNAPTDGASGILRKVANSKIFGATFGGQTSMTPTHDAVRSWLHNYRTRDEESSTAKAAPGLRPQGESSNLGTLVSGDCSNGRKTFNDALRRGMSFKDAARIALDATMSTVTPSSPPSTSAPQMPPTATDTIAKLAKRYKR
jgi:hypothetical protein